MKKIVTLLFALIALSIPVKVFAKGIFSYIIIKGPGISRDLKVTTPGLMDFFAFADFSKGHLDAPASPGKGYEVIRPFIDSQTKRVQDFDHLHYYPETGYVFYDGLINGYSEYDGKWYHALPGVESTFLGALPKNNLIAWLSFAALAILLIGSLQIYRTRTAAQKSSIANPKL